MHIISANCPKSFNVLPENAWKTTEAINSLKNEAVHDGVWTTFWVLETGNQTRTQHIV